MEEQNERSLTAWGLQAEEAARIKADREEERAAKMTSNNRAEAMRKTGRLTRAVPINMKLKERKMKRLKLIYVVIIMILFSGCFATNAAKQAGYVLRGRGPDVERTFVAPTSIEGKNCVMQCKQIQNQCVQIEMQATKSNSPVPGARSWAGVFERTKCDEEYDVCFEQCGGKVIIINK